MMKLKYSGPEAMNLDVAQHRDGNSILNDGDSFEVPEKLGKKLIASSAAFQEVGSNKGDS